MPLVEAKLELSLDDGPQSWSLVTSQLEEFIGAWEADPVLSGAAPPPALAPFLHDLPAAQRRMLLVELIKIDLEYRCVDDQAPGYSKPSAYNVVHQQGLHCVTLR